MQLRPTDASGHYALGLALQALQEMPEAHKQFEKSIQLQPLQTEAYFQLGLMDLEDHNLDSASERFNRVLLRAPEHAGALFGMGRVQFEKKITAKLRSSWNRRSLLIHPYGKRITIWAWPMLGLTEKMIRKKN